MNSNHDSESLSFAEPFRLFACCPFCGNKLGKSAAGTDTETYCNVCGNFVEYKVKDNTVALKLLSKEKRSKKKKSQSDNNNIAS